MEQRPTRRNYEESCLELQKAGWLRAGALPPLPSKRPAYDDEEPLGVEFFRTRVSDAKFDNLTLPRTFFGRSEIRNVSFVASELSESTFCWNDFIWVDFSLCDLSRSDLRAASFDSVKFCGSSLVDCDLRRSDFSDCDFSRANFHRAKLTRSQAKGMRLSPEQMQQVDWQTSDGEEPGGG